ncbi:hypothetical protein KL86DES1_20255 [uncultured Desulfovibrio sp.]|uniref:Uncharacterized protein n=1 Tax=uncultured Desulfovibrio sp. TaxID=167968 RepID=A0A212L2W0_9BACT|nr:hypothetical protein KL86DES1_20255 [uncultured Desulfovibrio sp.]VZH33156.1 conserved protein of unknown function [Desulfovibrio sp. 86]
MALCLTGCCILSGTRQPVAKSYARAPANWPGLLRCGEAAKTQGIPVVVRTPDKSFRGWGRGGGDPFAKGSLPHKVFL